MGDKVDVDALSEIDFVASRFETSEDYFAVIKITDVKVYSAVWRTTLFFDQITIDLCLDD
jgi:hypothetical protein